MDASLFWTAAEIVVALVLIFYFAGRKKVPLPLPVQFRILVWCFALLSVSMALGHFSFSLLSWCLCAGCAVFWCIWTVQNKASRWEPFLSLLVPLGLLAGLIWYHFLR